LLAALHLLLVALLRLVREALRLSQAAFQLQLLVAPLPFQALPQWLAAPRRLRVVLDLMVLAELSASLAVAALVERSPAETRRLRGDRPQEALVAPLPLREECRPLVLAARSPSTPPRQLLVALSPFHLVPAQQESAASSN
jgi:hypothetical protein